MTLTTRFPTSAATVLAGIGSSDGAAAVLDVRTVLDRLDALEKSNHKDDHQALAIVAKRAIDKNERKRVAALVDKAESMTPAAPDAAA